MFVALFNYNDCHSFVFLSMIDGDYKFMGPYIDPSVSVTDGQVFIQSELKGYIQDESAGIPPSEPLMSDVIHQLTASSQGKTLRLPPNRGRYINQ